MPIKTEKMFRRVQSKRIATGSEHVRKATALEVLRNEFKRTMEPYIGDIQNRVWRCKKHQRCNSPWCPTCSNPRASKAKRKNVSHSSRPLSGIVCSTTTNAKSTEYRVRGAQRMMEAFDGLPLVMCHPITINIGLIPIDGSLGRILEKLRARFRRMLMRTTNGAICRGKFDIVLKYLDELEFTIPEDEWPEGVDPKNPPHERYAMLHFHGVIFDSFLTHRELRKLVADEFLGNNRICLRRAHKTAELTDGTLCGGLQGYLEYASMEKIEIDFGDESADAVLDFAKINSTWKRTNRNFSYGKPIAHSGIVIDQQRVRELERKARLDQVKKNWSKLGFAHQFMHQWMSHAKEIAAAAKNRSSEQYDFRISFNQIYAYHCNWLRSKFFETVEFLDFLNMSKSELAEPPPKVALE